MNGMNQNVEVRVLQGPDPSAMQPTGYSFNVDGSKGSYVWQVRTSRTHAGASQISVD